MTYLKRSLLLIFFATSFLQAVTDESKIYNYSIFGMLLRPDTGREAILTYWLYLATWHQDLQKAQQFLDLGANANNQNEGRGRTVSNALWVAVATEQLNFVKLLLDYGAKPKHAHKTALYAGNIANEEYFLQNKIARLENPIPKNILNQYWGFGQYNPTVFELIAQMPQTANNREIAQLLNDYANGVKQPTRKPGSRSGDPLPSFQSQSATSPQPQQPSTYPSQQPTVQSQTTTSQKTSYQRSTLNLGWKPDQMLWVASFIGDLDEFKNALPAAQQKGLINNLYELAVGRGKMSALIAAIGRKDRDTSPAQYLQIIKMLIQAGSDPNLPDQFGRSPLIIAALSDAPVDFFQTLLDAGANPNVTDPNGTPLIDLIQDPNTKNFVQGYKPVVTPPPTAQPVQPQTPTQTITPLQTVLNTLTKTLNDLASAI